MVTSELQHARTLFEELRQAGRLPGHNESEGVTRETYGDGEDRAHRLIARAATSLGIVTQNDWAGNTWLGSFTGRPIVIGSHLDSVPCGGNFDGAAGVVAGLLVMARLRDAGLKVPLQVVALRGEESAWFGECYLGSKALLEGWSEATFSRVQRTTGRTLRQIFASVGKRLSTPLRSPETIRAFLELHIEQGPVLVDAKIPLGIVTGIRGNVRHTITCHGEAGHSGTTPMHARRDAVAATVELLYHWYDWYSKAAKFTGYNDLVATTGILHTDRTTESVSAIAAKTTFSVEWRSLDKSTLRGMSKDLRRMIRSNSFDCSFEVSPAIRSEPAKMTRSIQRHLTEAAAHLEIPSMAMPSGAGHDAAVFAKAGIPTGMLFVRNQNGSHNPKEAMDMADFMKGVDVLHRTVRQIAGAR